MSHQMKLREFIPDAGTAISLRDDLLIQSSNRGKSGGKTYTEDAGTDRPGEHYGTHGAMDGHTYAFYLPFDEMMITPVDFAAIIRLPFRGRSIIFYDQLRTPDRLGLWESLRAAIGMELPSPTRRCVMRVSSLTMRPCLGIVLLRWI
ncbi:hypothetical protein JCGZ_09846 [Jatropha curcas]|uniref:Uncharacterized protein n=1 Tax=Jatropha curcas TaxID=180498 RepID=A0A067JL64_JATCU|nr:hypothetical protein JCGZ_09846 [Jatropha curcas]